MKEKEETPLKDALSLLWVFLFLILAGAGFGIAVGIYHVMLRWFKVGN
jgi:hypothetical protein